MLSMQPRNRTKVFDRSLDKALSKYPRSRDGVENEIAAIHSLSGDRYPGFHSAHLRKSRIGLPEYKLSLRNGLRFVFLVTDAGDVVPVLVYKKGHPQREEEVKKLIRISLRQVLQELSRGDAT